MPAAQPSSRAVVITGCSSGIGAATALHLAGHVWATARDPERLTDLRAAGCRTPVAGRREARLTCFEFKKTEGAS